MKGELHTFKNTSNGEFVQYVNILKNSLGFYTSELDTNEKYFNSYFQYLKQIHSKLETIESMKIVSKEINEDEEDFIIIEVIKKDGWNNLICFSLRQNIAVGANIITNDEREKALKKLYMIYNSTKFVNQNRYRDRTPHY